MTANVTVKVFNIQFGEFLFVVVANDIYYRYESKTRYCF